MPNSVFLGPGLASGGTSIYLKPGPAYNGASVFLTPTVGGGTAPVLTYSDIILADGPSAYWPLQEPSGTAVVSLAAGAPNGVVSGGATLNSAGPWAGAKAILLDGLTGRVTMPTGAYEAFGTGGATIECWAKPLALKDSWWFDLKADGGGDPGLSVHDLGTGAMQGYVRNANWGGTSTTTGPVLVNGTWVYLVVFLQRGSPDSLGLYINGADATGSASLPLTGENITSVDGLMLGNFVGGADAACVNIAFAHVAVYLKTLTPAQISAHFLAGHA